MSLFLLFLVLVVLIPTSGFFDLYLLPWQSRLIFTENPSLWHAMRHNPAAYLPFTHFSALPYGPLFYYPVAFWLFCLDKARIIDLVAWDNFGLAPDSVKYTALLKVPNLAIYLAVGIALLKIIPGRAGQDAMLLWLLNPVVILGSFVMGQNDSWSLLGVLVATVLAARALKGDGDLHLGPIRLPRRVLAMAVLGASAAAKLQPLLFVIPFALVLGKTYRERLLLTFVAFSAFGLFVAPFISDPFFREHALFNPQSRDILNYRAGPLPIFYPAYAAAVLLCGVSTRGLQGLLAALIGVNLLIFALSDWPPERGMWFIGALAIPAVLNRAGLAAYAMTTVQVLLVAMGLGNDLGLGVFALVSKQFELWPGLNGALERIWDYDQIVTWGRWLGVAAWSLALFTIIRRRNIRPTPLPEMIPIGTLLLLPAFFGGALLYGMTGWSTTPGVQGPDRVAGPAIVEQHFTASAFTNVDVSYVAPDNALPQAELELGFGPGPARLIGATTLGDGYLRLRFQPLLLTGRGEHVLRLNFPEGATIGTVERPKEGFSSASVNGNQVSYALAVRVNRQPAWSAIGDDVRRKFKGNVPTLAATAILFGSSLFLLGWYAGRDQHFPSRFATHR